MLRSFRVTIVNDRGLEGSMSGYLGVTQSDLEYLTFASISSPLSIYRGFLILPGIRGWRKGKGFVIMVS